MKKCAIILSGCGVYDGSEIHESCLLTYFLDLHEISITFLAPNINQTDCIDHNIGKPMEKNTRNCLVESARIARGNITELKTANVDSFDFAIFPGGYGAAKNLSTFATENENLTINKDVETFILSMNKLNKPLGFICISPVIAAKLFPKVRCTLGLDQENLNMLTKIGATATQANYDDVVIDSEFKIFSTPAYMVTESISKVGVGIKKLVDTMLSSISDT